jgi:hypothetical protein
LAAGADGGGQFGQYGGGGVEVHARVGHALPVAERLPGAWRLAALDQEALQHHPGQAVLAGRHLLRDRGGHHRLAAVVLAAVAVARVHHQPARHPGRADQVERLGDVAGLVVRAGAAAAQDHVRVRVSRRGHHRGDAVVGDAEERVPGGRRPARVHRHLDVAVRPVLESDRHRQAGGELAVDLALGGPRTDRAPGHRVRDVLRRDRVEPFAAHRQAEGDDVEQQLPGGAQAAVHVVPAVHVRVVDQPLPAGHGPRLLEVHPHDDQQVGAAAVAEEEQTACVLERGPWVVHRAGPGDHEQPVVGAVEDGADFGPALLHGGRGRVAERQLVEQGRRGKQRLVPGDAGVTGARHRARLLPGRAATRTWEPAHPLALTGLSFASLAPGGDKRRRERLAPPGARVKRR